MDQIVWLIFAFSIGYFIGCMWTINKIRKDLDQLDDEFGDNYDIESDTVDQEVDAHIMITIEIHDNMIFIYNAETGKYMAHGKTHESVKQQLVEKFPGIIFEATEENIKLLETL